jgi:hypothetical protein
MSDWARMSDGVARRECEALARALPHGLEFNGLEIYDYCGRTHRIARFARRDDLIQFVLVPGGEVTLGFDGRGFKPSYWQIVSFADSAKEFDIDPSIRRFVDTQTSSPRRACLAPALVEIEAQSIDQRQDLVPLGEVS